MKVCGIATEQHFLDHLVPLCSLFQAPILCLNLETAQFGELFYPETACIFQEQEHWDTFLNDYDFIIYVHFHRTFPYGFHFVDYQCNQKKRSLFSLHGQPDKFHSIYWMERILEEDLVLAYGNKLLDIFKQKGIDQKLNPIISGNYRLAYYKKNRIFFQKKIHHFLFEKTKTTILFAPTWSQQQKFSQFSDFYSPLEKTCRFLLENIPNDVQLYIKLHPLFIADHLEHFLEMEKKIKEHPNVKLIHNLPLIYPLLEHIDILVGDYSSIGYDFLYFDRPLFFLSEMHTDLHACGRVLSEDEWPNCYKIFQEDHSFLSEKRKKTYDYVFGEEKSLTQLKKEIEERL